MAKKKKKKAGKDKPKERRSVMKPTPDDNEFRINLSQLDREWVRQSGYVHAYGQQQAAAKRDLEEAKSQLEATRAMIAKEVRADPEKFDLERATVDATKDAVQLDERYQAAEAKVREAKYKVDMLAAALNTLEHKKAALQNLVTLHGRDYFSEPVAEEGATPPKRRRGKKRAQEEKE